MSCCSPNVKPSRHKTDLGYSSMGILLDLKDSRAGYP